MYNRHAGMGTKANEDNKRVVKSVLYPTIPRDASDIYVITTPGDRLDLLAKKYYNSVGLWWIIAQANGIGKGSMTIPVGLQLRIPTTIAKIQQDFLDLNI